MKSALAIITPLLVLVIWNWLQRESPPSGCPLVEKIAPVARNGDWALVSRAINNWRREGGGETSDCATHIDIYDALAHVYLGTPSQAQELLLGAELRTDYTGSVRHLGEYAYTVLERFWGRDRNALESLQGLVRSTEGLPCADVRFDTLYDLIVLEAHFGEWANVNGYLRDIELSLCSDGVRLTRVTLLRGLVEYLRGGNLARHRLAAMDPEGLSEMRQGVRLLYLGLWEDLYQGSANSTESRSEAEIFESIGDVWHQFEICIVQIDRALRAEDVPNAKAELDELRQKVEATIKADAHEGVPYGKPLQRFKLLIDVFDVQIDLLELRRNPDDDALAQEMQEAVSVVLKRAKDAELPLFQIRAHVALAELGCIVGKSSEVKERFQEAIDLAKETGFRNEVAVVLARRAEFCRTMDDVDCLVRDLKEAIAIYAELGNRPMEEEYRRYLTAMEPGSAWNLSRLLKTDD